MSDLEESASLEANLDVELNRLYEMCGDLQFAVIATDEGLALSTWGTSMPDAACATVAFLINWLNTHLGMLQVGCAHEVLIWTDIGPCYIARIASLPYVIALFSAEKVPAAVLRHAGALTASRLAPVLASLTGVPSGRPGGGAQSEVKT